MNRVRIFTTMSLTFASLSGDLPKQVKVKKLSKLKTLDTKPGHPTDFTHLCIMNKMGLHCDESSLPVCRALHGVQDVSTQRQGAD